MQGIDEPNTDLFAEANKPLNPMNKQKVRVTPTLLFFERGGLTTNAQQIPLAQVQDVDAMQSMTQKARGTGSVRVVVHRPAGMENVLLEDFPSFRQLVDVINEAARTARMNEMRMQQTQTVHYGGGSVQQQAVPQQPAVDPIEQLERLGKLRDAGVITPEEFEAKKAEWLSRM